MFGYPDHVHYVYTLTDLDEDDDDNDDYSDNNNDNNPLPAACRIWRDPRIPTLSLWSRHPWLCSKRSDLPLDNLSSDMQKQTDAEAAEPEARGRTVPPHFSKYPFLHRKEAPFTSDKLPFYFLIDVHSTFL